MKYYVDSDGKYVGAFEMPKDKDNNELDHLDVPAGAQEVPKAPNDARQKWNGTGYDDVVVTDTEFNAQVDAELQAIDAESIRSIREYISAQPDAPQTLKDHEALAISKRATRK